jgi:hypothetical protein
LIGVPVAWAVLLLFHPTGAGDIYPQLRDEVTRWQVVHVGTLIFIPLMAVAIFVLLRGLDSTAAQVSRVAAVIFVVFYGAWEVLQGIGVGVLTDAVNELPAADRRTGSELVQAFSQDNKLNGDPGVFTYVAGLAWVTAVVAAAVALRRGGAPLSVAILVALSALIAAHPPPFGPLGLAFFAIAIVLLVRGQSAPRPAAVRAGSARNKPAV